MTVLTELDRMREAVGEDEWLVAGSLNGACKLIANGATVGIAFDLHRSHAAYIAALHKAYPLLRAEIERLRGELAGTYEVRKAAAEAQALANLRAAGMNLSAPQEQKAGAAKMPDGDPAWLATAPMAQRRLALSPASQPEEG